MLAAVEPHRRGIVDWREANAVFGMEHVGELISAKKVTDPGETASVYDVLVNATNTEVQPQSGGYSECLLQAYTTSTNPAQPAPAPPPHHPAFSTRTNQNIQNQPEGGEYSEGLPQVYPTDTNPAQPAPLPHHHDPPVPTWPAQNIQVQPEAVEYWKGLPQAYTVNTSNSQPAPPPHNHSSFPTWPQQSIQIQPETGLGPPQAYKTNSNPAHPPPFPPLPPPPPHHPHPPFPTWPEQNIQVQPQSGGYWSGPFRQTAPYAMTAPSTYHGSQCQEDAMLQSHIYSAGYAYDQGQHQPCIWPADAGWPKPAAPEHTHDERLLLTLIDGTEQSLPCVGVMDNGATIHELPDDLLSQLPAIPLPNTDTSIEVNHGQQLKDDMAYIKKPPNAFMLFLEEQRPYVSPELRRQGTSKVNKALGKKWKTLTMQEKAVYFQQAKRKALLHKQLYPGWNNSKNYGKKRKRKRGKVCERNEASATENIPQANTGEQSHLLDSLMQTSLLEQHYVQDAVIHAGLMEPQHQQESLIQAGVMQPRHMQDAVILTGVMQPQHPHDSVVQVGAADHPQDAVTQTGAMELQHPRDAAIEPCHLQDTLEQYQDTQILLPFLACEMFDLSTVIDNLDFWPDGFLANGTQDSHAQQG